MRNFRQGKHFGQEHIFQNRKEITKSKSPYLKGCFTCHILPGNMIACRLYNMIRGEGYNCQRALEERERVLKQIEKKIL